MGNVRYGFAYAATEVAIRLPCLSCHDFFFVPSLGPAAPPYVRAVFVGVD